MNRTGPEDQERTLGQSALCTSGRGKFLLDSELNLSERNAGGWCWTLHRFQVVQKYPDAALTCWPLWNSKVLLPHVYHTLPEAGAVLLWQCPGVSGRRQLWHTLNVCQHGGQQLSGAEMEPVDLQQSEMKEVKAKVSSRVPLPHPQPHPNTVSLTSRFSCELRTSWAPTQSRVAARSLAHRSASDWAKSSSPEILASADAALSDGASFFLAMTLAASKLAPAAR